MKATKKKYVTADKEIRELAVGKGESKSNKEFVYPKKEKRLWK